MDLQLPTGQEFKNLQSKSAKCLSLVRQLRLLLDKDGYMRCGGRIHNAPLSKLLKFPYLLPSKYPLTFLVNSTNFMVL